ncbi:thioredoxin domain-containing protein [Candidatus Microgenomates bacterium]|nr:thioredoxin domain-containing protein [Candidatus Microgenomates bacterium]
MEDKTSKKSGVVEKLVPALLIVSVGLSFLLGVLWQKVTTLEGSGTKVAGTTQGNSTSGDQPTNGKLSSEQAKKVPSVSDEDYIRGSKDAKVYLIEYSDLECPFCKQFHKTAQQAVDEYDGQVAWVYRHFPLDTLHPKADKEAEAAECAAEQKGVDGFWAYVDKVFAITPSNNGLDHAELPKIATQIGLDESKFQSCLDSGKYKDKVEEQYQGGVTAGVSGTPGNFIVNQKGEVWIVPGAVPYDQLKSVIDEALKS